MPLWYPSHVSDQSVARIPTLAACIKAVGYVPSQSLPYLID